MSMYLALVSWTLIVPCCLSQTASPRPTESPCSNYKLLNSATRSQFYDFRLISNGKKECDKHSFKVSWYRITGSAGTKMPDKVVTRFRCGGHSPGWLRGGHPTIRDGIVNRTVCFTWFNKDNCTWRRKVSVQNCSGFYVYRLQAAPLCDLRYCGDGFPAPPLSCVPGNTSFDVDGTIPGEIKSPGHPGPYPHNQHCSWLIKVPLGNLVRVSVNDLDLTGEDNLTIADGDRSRSIDIAKYSHCGKGEISLFSSGTAMLITFRSGAVKSSSGFSLKYKSVRRRVLLDAGNVGGCSGNTHVGGEMGFIGHAGFPGPVKGGRRCMWTVDVPEGKRVLFKFHWMGMELGKGSDPFCDENVARLKLTGQPGSSAYCSCSVPPSGWSINNRGYVQHVWRHKSYLPGFLLEYRAIDPKDCPGADASSCKFKDIKPGFNRFGKVWYEPDIIPTTTPTPPPPKKTTTVKHDPFHVTCTRDAMEVLLDLNQFKGLDYNSSHLNDPKCTAISANSVQVHLRTALDKCGTTYNYSKDGVYIQYHNNIMVDKVTRKNKDDVITRDHQAVFAFTCQYHKRFIMTVEEFSPAEAFVATKGVAGYGNFTYRMQMFKSSKYKEPYTRYPVTIRSNNPMYLQLAVTSNDSHLVLFVDTCYATPTSDPNDKEKYTFLEEGCGRDEALQYKYDHTSNTQRFDLRAFYFATFDHDTIHLHCKVLVCQEKETNTRCEKGCPYGRRLKRAQPGVEEQTALWLRVGPIKKWEDSVRDDSAIDRSPRQESRSYMVEIVAGTLGFVVFVLLMAVVLFVLVKPQGKRAATEVLLVKDSD